MSADSERMERMADAIEDLGRSLNALTVAVTALTSTARTAREHLQPYSVGKAGMFGYTEGQTEPPTEIQAASARAWLKDGQTRLIPKWEADIAVPLAHEIVKRYEESQS